jgi:GNAT superfamily N-acetyltransferase
MNYKIIHRSPTVGEYNGLRASVGWPQFEPGLVEKGLGNSLFAVVIEDDQQRVIAMGRIVGDGFIYLHIQDVIVRPEFQGIGIGKVLMTALMKFVETSGGLNTNIGLMCSKGREPFYQEFGFAIRPNEKYGAGMIMVKK